nr:LOW QUALITY PROTEIN: 28S ribosomal protein S7, mitochondrial-like [Saimiri boliviensis boliviensis]
MDLEQHLEKAILNQRTETQAEDPEESFSPVSRRVLRRTEGSLCGVLVASQDGCPHSEGFPRRTQVRWSCSSAEFRDPLIDKERYGRPVEKLTEECDWALEKTQLIKAAPAVKTSSVSEDPAVSKFTNMTMKGGSKILVRSLVTQTLEAVKRKQFEKYHVASAEEQATIEQNPYTIFHQALKNGEPMTGLVPILRGGRFYQVPEPPSDPHRCFLAVKWVMAECWENKHRRTLMPEKLSHELLEAFHNQGPGIKRKHDMHNMAEAKDALAHYR